MIFRTEIDIAPPGPEMAGMPGMTLDHATPVFAVGSCFAESIACRLARAKFSVTKNPFGVVFNPASIASEIERLLSGKPYTASDMVSDGGLWYSWEHHGSLSTPTLDGALEKANAALAQGSKALREAGTLIVTLGTAWVYEREGRVVSNCHKAPAGEFTRRRMEVDEVVETLARTFAKLAEKLPAKNIILTVSPVRHVKDGLAENSLSKATLIVAAHRLTAYAHYFPAYEIVIDDLRDYRFYGADMVHPSEQAVDYVWEKFCEAMMSAATREVAHEAERLAEAMAHRPLNPATEGHRAFLRVMHGRCAALAASHPGLDLRAELAYFSAAAAEPSAAPAPVSSAQ